MSPNGTLSFKTMTREPEQRLPGSAKVPYPEPLPLEERDESAITEITNPKIQIKDLNFFYGKYHALESISMQVAENRVTAFIGPSGCGKSTLLRSFNRIYELYPEQRATGEILFDGNNMLDKKQDVNLLRAKVGMVFQKPTPFPMSIYDNIAFGVRLYERLSRAEMARSRRVGPAQSGAMGRGQRQAQAERRAPSGGQQQRLCIARAIAVKPEVLLLDEPASALDPISTAHIEELIDELKNDYTIVIVTHNMQQAARVSDYTAFMYLGRLIEFGKTEHHLHQSAAQRNGRLHYRALRLTQVAGRRSQVAGRRSTTCYDFSGESVLPPLPPRESNCV